MTLGLVALKAEASVTLTRRPKKPSLSASHAALSSASRLLFAPYALPRAVCARLTGHRQSKKHRHEAAAGKVLKCVSLLSSYFPLMLSHHLVLFELFVKVVSLQLVSWAACHLNREYMKAVLEVANECLTIAESFYASRAIVPARV